MLGLVLKGQIKDRPGYFFDTTSRRWKKVPKSQVSQPTKAAEEKPAPLGSEEHAESAENERVWDSAVKLFGVTTDPAEAGWILPDGRMLDFSEKRDGGTPGMRSDDHRSISRAFREAKVGIGDGYSDGMMEALYRGAVRIGYQRNKRAYNDDTLAVNIGAPLTPEQRNVLSRLVRSSSEISLDADFKDSNESKSTFLDGRIPAHKVFGFLDSAHPAKKSLISLIFAKSLLTDHHQRQHEHVHITHVVDGRPVKGHANHQTKDGYTLEDWKSDITWQLMEHADSQPEDGEIAWLNSRGIRLPDSDDIVTRRTANQWLRKYGPIAFALGIPLKSLEGATIASPRELPSEGPILAFNVSKGLSVGAMKRSSVGGQGRPKTGKYGLIVLPNGVRRLKKEDMGHEAERMAYYQSEGIPAQYLPPTEPGPYKAAKLKKLWAQYDADQVARQREVAIAELPTPEPEKPVGGRSLPEMLADRLSQFTHPVDLGFDAYQQPMAYLLSLGWEKRVGEKNQFRDYEKNALMREFEGPVARLARRAARGVVGDADQPGARSLYDEVRQELEQKGLLWVYNSALAYEPKVEPSQRNNFARKVHAGLPRVLHGAAVNYMKRRQRRGGSGKTQTVSYEDVTEKPTLPATRPETPFQAIQRQELEGQVADILQQLLNPIEWLVVKHRLNIEDVAGKPRTDTTGGDVGRPEGHDEPIKFTQETGGLKRWDHVKEDVVADLVTVLPKHQVAEEQERLGHKTIRSGFFQDRFDSAMRSLRSPFSTKGKLAAEHKRILEDYARIKRLYLEGARHRTWDPSEAITVKLEALPKDPKKNRSLWAGSELSTMSKGALILDTSRPFEALVDELAVWEMNGY